MWNQETMKALGEWVGHSLFPKGEPHDIDKFHHFILALWDETHSNWGPREARPLLVRVAKESHPDDDEQYLIDLIERFIEKGSTILDFLESCSGFDKRTL